MAKFKKELTRLEIVSEIDGVRRILGYPFVLLAALTAWSWSRGGVTLEGGEPAGPLFVLVVIALFGIPGFGLGFGRVRLIVDQQSRQATRWIGALVPVYVQSLPWQEVQSVALESRSRRSNRHSYTAYAVVLHTDKTSISSPDISDVHRARAFARRVAVFVDRPLHDKLIGRVTPKEQLVGDLAQRLKRRGCEPPKSDLPPERVSADRQGGDLRLRLEPAEPTFGTQIWTWLQIGAVALVVSPIAYTVLMGLFSPRADRDAWPLLVPWIGILLGGLWYMFRIHRASRRRRETVEELEVTGRQFVLRRTWQGKAEEIHSSLKEIDELALDRRAIVLVLDDREVYCAEGVDQAARCWTYAALTSHIASL